NQAAHDTRQFRFSESLTAWEHIYTIVKWFVEVYVSYDIQVPEYVDPMMRSDHMYGLEEMALRFKKIEELLKQSLERDQSKTADQRDDRDGKNTDHPAEVRQNSDISNNRDYVAEVSTM